MKAILTETTLNQEMVNDIGEVASTVAYWANIELLFLATQQTEVSTSLNELKSSIARLYEVILEWEVKLLNISGAFLGTCLFSFLFFLFANSSYKYGKKVC